MKQLKSVKYKVYCDAGTQCWKQAQYQVLNTFDMNVRQMVKDKIGSQMCNQLEDDFYEKTEQKKET